MKRIIIVITSKIGSTQDADEMEGDPVNLSDVHPLSGGPAPRHPHHGGRPFFLVMLIEWSEDLFDIIITLNLRD